MALKKIYIGSLGPHLYDDANLIDDPDGDFAGETQDGATTDGQFLVEGAPTKANHVARWQDVQQGDAAAFFFGML